MNRLEFVRKSGAAALLISMGIGLEGCNDDSDDMAPADDMDNDQIISFDLTASPFDVLQNEDSWLLHPKENILLVNVGGSLRAFTSVCTHSGCNDDWTYGNSTFTCNCHGSMFNNSGEVINGPASSNLKEYNVAVDNNLVSINVN